MAVKPEKIKERLKAKYPKANLSTKRLDEYSAKLATRPADDADDDAIDAILEEANSLIDFEATAKEDDRIRTLEAKLKEPKQSDPADPKPADPTDPKDPNQALLDAIKGLTDKVDAIEKGKTLETKKQTALAAVQKSEAFKSMKPEDQQRWADRINPDAEASIEDQVKGFETELDGLRQEFANSESFAGPTPRGSGDTKMSAEEAANIVDQIL